MKRYDIMLDREKGFYCVYEDGVFIGIDTTYCWSSLEEAKAALDRLEESQKPRMESVYHRSF